MAWAANDLRPDGEKEELGAVRTFGHGQAEKVSIVHLIPMMLRAALTMGVPLSMTTVPP